MALNFMLPVGQQVVGQAAGAVTNLVGTTQGDVSLGAFRVECTDNGTNNIQGDAVLSDFRIANQSVFCSNGDGFPAAALQSRVQASDFIVGVTLAAGTNVQYQITGGTAVGGYDVAGYICTDPILPGELPEGAAAGDFSLSDIALLFPLNRAALGGAPGAQVVMEAVCNRTATLGKLFLTDVTNNNGISITSILVGGEEQLAQSTTVGIPISAFSPLATLNDGDMDLDKVITPGESVQITLQNQTAVAATVFGGIYCK